MAQLWGGRFTKETDQLVYNFNASITFDQKFYKEDIEGSEYDTNAQVLTHATAYLAAGHRHAQQRHDECTNRGGPTFVPFHLESLDISASALALALHIMAQFGCRHLLCMLGGDEEFVGNDRQGDIHALCALERLMQAFERPFGIVVEMPLLERVVIDTVGGDTLHERLALKLLDRAAVTDAGTALERLHVEDGAWLDLHLDITCALLGEMLHVAIGEGQHPL